MTDIGLLIAVIFTISLLYGAYAGHITPYLASSAFLLLLLIYHTQYLLSRKLGEIGRVESLLKTVERWIRNEDIRRDLEALPLFVEERQKEYVRGLKEGYERISEVLNALDEIRRKIEAGSRDKEEVRPLREKRRRYMIWRGRSATRYGVRRLRRIRRARVR